MAGPLSGLGDAGYLWAGTVPAEAVIVLSSQPEWGCCFVDATMSSSRQRRPDPSSIVDRARSNGYQSRRHEENDRQRGLRKFDDKTLKTQDRVLHIYTTWSWGNSDHRGSFDDFELQALRPGAPVPEIHSLKDFWRFYKDQARGRLSSRPTVRTLRSCAKSFKAGFLRRTGNTLSEADTAEINSWMLNVLSQEEHSGVRDLEMPKYNYQHEDLDRNISTLWTSAELGYIHERNRLQFHFLLLLFCNSAGRCGAVFNKGLPYKDIRLVLKRTEGKPHFLYRPDQRHVKNNKDPTNKKFGITGYEHAVLRYDVVFLLINFAIADGALDRHAFMRIIDGEGEGPIEWLPEAQDRFICQALDSSGNCHPSKWMTGSTFDSIFARVLMKDYNYSKASVHAIQRQVAKGLDERYTETERSQHVLHTDPRIMGQSYVAFVSSCDTLLSCMTPNPRRHEHLRPIAWIAVHILPGQEK
ncbi:uncharacterized protein B0I36DRAFT_167208 [Microdochium trichocladiopsis]|uniref:Uncharacterized protein n=1 Tax=Microdochium trichocladiopsis TaxID=1682393 RepID=A0A9P8Y112_9PEZI|nr:uncharacterized protein B0I36DRAFT_167208 [Microdochium trichocladiopsis]KAH7025258.1 hypothetical protein B0I36DRAFT_167208 [Microdochium trichocladiopsis]